MEKSAVRIMALDDDPFMLKLLTHVVTRLGFTDVTTHENGHVALQWIDAQPLAPELILLDLNMPEMDGVEFLRHMVNRHYAGNFILISGEEERMLQAVERLVQAHNIPVLGHLQKPVKPEILSTILQQWQTREMGEAEVEHKIYTPESLRIALDQRQLVNHYQPKVAVATGELVGVETLVRWQHPTDGLVFPGQFVDIAEKHELIDDLTRWVLTEALTQANLWQQAGLDLRVAINVSMDNLASPDFTNFVVAQATAAGLQPSRILLELTESRLMQDDQRASLESLTRLRLKRFTLSIDDFGTGHSSLTRLHDIPFDELKIDQRFVHRAWDDSTARAMYDASLGLARQLGMAVVAEGIEDQNDWDFVRQTGCDYAQGYWIARPMPASDLPAWISSWHERMKR